jgi:hypothetical protein
MRDKSRLDSGLHPKELKMIVYTLEANNRLFVSVRYTLWEMELTVAN